MPPVNFVEKRISGIGVSEGIRFGRAFLFGQPAAHATFAEQIDADQLETELKRQDSAKARALAELEGIIEKSKATLGEEKSVIIQGQRSFLKNQINIPSDAKLTFTIDPNKFKLTVSGTEDKEFIGQIEEALNSARNSRELFVHIIQSRSDDSIQFTREKFEKYHLVREIKNVTGYDLKNLTVANGKFITEDGTDIFDIYKNALRKIPYINTEGNGVFENYYGSQLERFARIGFDAVPDLFLSIGYESGSLQDIGQKESYGMGKTDWIGEWKANVASLN